MPPSTLPKNFPKGQYLKGIVEVLDTISYRDTNLTRDERVDRLHYVYTETARHFAERKVHEQLGFPLKKLDALVRTITLLLVDCWVACSKELLASLTIYFLYTAILDDTDKDPRAMTESFFQDGPARLKHPAMRLVDAHMRDLLRHYGPFCSLGIYRSTVDALHSKWIENDNFAGFPGNEDYPEFLRRLNGLGHVVGTTIFPAASFPEEKYLREITTSMCQLECWMAWSNDVISFYKEFDDVDDNTTLVKSYQVTGGLSQDEALDKALQNTNRVARQITSVFADRDERVKDTMMKFLHGYMTWHLCDKRYRMSEVYGAVAGDEDEVSVKFRGYYEAAQKAGAVDPQEWATGPTFMELVEDKEEKERREKQWGVDLRLSSMVPSRKQKVDMDLRKLLMALIVSVLGCAASVAIRV